MGEVYLARDTRLDRTVAVKVLPPEMASSPESRQRFEREARAISALQHPNICTLLDVGAQDGVEFLVMEYLEGETLADRLKRGPLPVARVLEIGAEAAAALAKAHRQGIVHRDLKPGNIMLTKSGAKLLDFGLAKPAAMAPLDTMVTQTLGSGEKLSASPVTAKGEIVGTLQYMAPEQLEGRETDARTDIFALGTVLYEMATGQRAFAGQSQASVVAAILEREPEPISKIQPLSTPALESAVQRCLAKDPEERWQSASDLASELRWMRGASSAGVVAPVAPSPRNLLRQYAPWTIAALATLALLAALFFLQRPVSSPVLRADLVPPPGATYLLSTSDADGPPVLSRDGRYLAFVVQEPSGIQRIWIRQFSIGEPQPLAGTEGAAYPFWSPDGNSLGFFAGGKLRRISVGGGPVTTICNVQRARAGAWGADDTIIFAPSINSPIYGVKATADTTPKPVTRLDTSLHSTHRYPVFLPDGKRFLYLASNHSHPEATASNGIYLASLDGKENRFLLPANSNVAVVPGYLLLMQGNTLIAQGFDAGSGTINGEPLPVAQHVFWNPGTWHAAFTASDNGLLVFAPGGDRGARRLVWYGMDGKSLGQLGRDDAYWEISLSPDGRSLAMALGDPSPKLWVYDLNAGTSRRLQFADVIDRAPVWSPDGAYIAFAESENDNNKVSIYRKLASGARDAELLYSSPNASEAVEDKDVIDWSPDGKFLLFRQRISGHLAILQLPLSGDRTPRPILSGTNDYFGAHLSPDGHWLVYCSSEIGSSDVFVTTFPDLAGKWQVSSNGGEGPNWQRDGKAVYFFGMDHTLMKAPISISGAALTVGDLVPVAKPNALGNYYDAASVYDISPDGKRFIVISLTDSPASLSLVTNWTAALPHK